MIGYWCMMQHVHVLQENLEQLVNTATAHNQSAILAIPVRDTFKTGTLKIRLKTVSRELLWQAQTRRWQN